MANPLPLPGLGNPLPTRHRSFQSFYNDEELDPYRGQYDRVLTRLNVDANPNVTLAMLYEQAVGSGVAPQAYICCATSQQTTKIYCIHLPSRFVSALDGVATPWDGKGFAFLGEVTQTTVTTVDFPANAFRAIMNTRAKTSDYIVTHLDELGPRGLVPPDAADQDSNLVNTRMIMYLPARYAALLLNPAGYSLKETWDILYPAIIDANDLVNCQTLIDWLRVATTGTELANNANAQGPSTVAMDLTAPIADAKLIRHRNQVLKQALPALFQPSETLENAIAQMAVAVTQNTNDSRLAREQKAADATEPKLPSAKFTIMIGILLGYLEIPDERNLPALWHHWANCSKRQELMVLMDMLTSYSRGQEAFTNSTPVPTSKLVQDLLTFTFLGDSPEDIKTGLQPFIIAEGAAEHRQANLEVARMYGLLNSGEQTILLSDLEQLKNREVTSLPMNYFELERNLGMFGNLLGTVLGSGHTLTTAYRSFWTLISQAYRTELQQVIDVRHYVKPAHILRSIQLVCYNWFAQKRARLTPQPPEFTFIAYNIMLNTYVLPMLPQPIYKLAYPKQGPPSIVSAGTPSITSSSGSSNSSNTGTTGMASSAGSVISGITNPSVLTPPSHGTPGGTPTTRAKGSFQANLNPDRSLQQLLDYGTSLKSLIGNDPPPTLDDGSPVCLSYYLRNGCWSNCRRANTHNRTLSAAEKAKLETYLRQRVATLRTTQPPP